jgi:S-adenosylmethionine synthetase
MIEVAYAIGKAHPVSLLVETFGTGKITDDKLGAMVLEHFDPRPSNSIKEQQLEQPIDTPTSTYGHFGWAKLL